MRNKAYWERRASKRMYGYMQDAERTAADIAKAYEASMRYISEEAEKVMRAFQGLTGVSEAEAQRLLSHAEGKKTIDQLKNMIARIADGDIRKSMLARINAPAYAARIGRLDTLQRDIDRQCRMLYQTQLSVDTEHFRRLCGDAYLRTMYDMQRGTGLAFSFAQMPKSRINEILRDPWSGEHYSNRIWGNVQDMGQQLKEELLAGFMTGRSYDKTARAIAQRFGVGMSEARRLVRTDSCYIANQAELESYRECDIELYRYVATPDGKTSPVCRRLDGKTFPVEDGKPGVNMPPMHPWCRSTTIADIDEDILAGMQRRARDPETGEVRTVPANMTYEEWEKEYRILKGEPKNDIIISGRDKVGISVEIDKFTPCLVERETGKTVNTTYSKASQSELKALKNKGWNFDWTADDLKDAVVYKLTLENDDVIQGLVALTDFPRDNAVYINVAESAPHNLGETKRYEGVGGHLFAIAAQTSVNNGYDGFMFLDAKNTDLVEYYHEKFGATLLGMPHPYRMFIDEYHANQLLSIYTLKGE